MTSADAPLCLDCARKDDEIRILNGQVRAIERLLELRRAYSNSLVKEILRLSAELPTTGAVEAVRARAWGEGGRGYGD